MRRSEEYQLRWLLSAEQTVVDRRIPLAAHCRYRNSAERLLRIAGRATGSARFPVAAAALAAAIVPVVLG